MSRNNWYPGEKQPAPRPPSIRRFSASFMFCLLMLYAAAVLATALLHSPTSTRILPAPASVAQPPGPMIYSRDGRAVAIEGVPIAGWQLVTYSPTADDVACVRAMKQHGTPREFAIAGRVFLVPPDGIAHVAIDCPHEGRRVKVTAARAQRVPYADAVALAAKLGADAHGMAAATVEAVGNDCSRRARERPGRDVVLSRAGVSIACALDAGVFSIEASAK